MLGDSLPNQYGLGFSVHTGNDQILRIAVPERGPGAKRFRYRGVGAKLEKLRHQRRASRRYAGMAALTLLRSPDFRRTADCIAPQPRAGLFDVCLLVVWSVATSASILGNWARGHTTPKTRSPSRDPLSVCASFVGNLIEPYRFAPRLRRQFKERLWLLVNASDRATAGRTAERFRRWRSRNRRNPCPKLSRGNFDHLFY